MCVCVCERVFFILKLLVLQVVQSCRRESGNGEGGLGGKMATIGLSKVFILDKYFTELQKFWETERKVQGIIIL